MKHILITGANGLLGQKLIYKLLPHPQVKITAVGRGENRLVNQEGYEYRDVDITDSQALSEVLHTTRPDIIIHTAAMTNVDACETQQETCRKINTEAVIYLTALCDEMKIHLIHLSTDFIFDGTAGPYDENATPNPLSFYGHSKWEAEKAVQNMKAPWAIIRTVLVYGIVDRMSRSNIVLWVKGSLEKGETISVVDDQFRTPTYAEDLAEGCILVALQQATGIFNISGKEFMNIYDLACLVADHYQLDKNLIRRVKSDTLNQPAKRPPVTGFILTKAEEQLGYQPTPFAQTLTIMDAQVKENL